MARLSQLLSNIDSTLKHVIAELGEPTPKSNDNIEDFYNNYGFKESIDPTKATEGNVPGLILYLVEWAEQLAPENIDKLLKDKRRTIQLEEEAAKRAHQEMPEPYKSQKRGRPDIQAERDTLELRERYTQARISGDRDAADAADREYKAALLKHVQVKDAYLKWEAHKYAAQVADKERRALEQRKTDISILSQGILKLAALLEDLRKEADLDAKRKLMITLKQQALLLSALAEQALRSIPVIKPKSVA